MIPALKRITLATLPSRTSFRSRPVPQRPAAAPPQWHPSPPLAGGSCPRPEQNRTAELKIAAGHWPFSMQFSTMATQKFDHECIKLYRWPIKISAKPKTLFLALGQYSNSLLMRSGLVNRFTFTAFYRLQYGEVCICTASNTKLSVLGMRLVITPLVYSQ